MVTDKKVYAHEHTNNCEERQSTMLKFHWSFLVFGDKKLDMLMIRSVTIPIGNRRMREMNAQPKDCSGFCDTGAALKTAKRKSDHNHNHNDNVVKVNK